MYYSTTYTSPVGNMTLACEGNHLVGIWLEGQKHFGGKISNEMIENSAMPVFNDAKNWLDRYFKGEKMDVAGLPLRPIGSEFQQRVWKVLCGIPYGEVTTYGAIAKKIAAQMGKERMSSQAVGGAIAHNPILIMVPCHRVVGTDGSMTGYAAGISVKRKLLELEGAEGFEKRGIGN